MPKGIALWLPKAPDIPMPVQARVMTKADRAKTRTLKWGMPKGKANIQAACQTWTMRRRPSQRPKLSTHTEPRPEVRDVCVNKPA